jgi:[ribosomal protein S5]-alanine N-acetyltransferase
MIWPLRKAAPTPVPTGLSTARLYLRPALVSDYDDWRRVRAKNQAYLQPFEPAWPEQCLERAFFERRIARLDQDWAEDRAYCFLILEVEGKNLIGGINLNNVARGAAQYAALGYWLSEEAQGQGYMTEAGRAILSFAFTKLHLARVNAATLPHNQKSRALLGRLGFQEEGFAKAYIQIDGVRADHVLYGLTADDFLCASR